MFPRQQQLEGISFFIFSACLSLAFKASSAGVRKGDKLKSSIKAKPSAFHEVRTVEEIRQYWQTENRDDENSFLKNVLTEESLDWVKSMNDHSLSYMGNPKDSPLYEKVLSILDSKDKIPYVTKIFEHYYNFWQDETNPRGIWRRTSSIALYESSDPNWETVLDFDELGREENESWVYKGSSILDLNDNHNEHLCLIKLSRGGADAVVTREFDLKTLKFVSKDPFLLPECKSRVSYKSVNTLLIGTDLQDGSSMTDSGYPRVVREWQRGTPLDATNAKLVFEGEATDVAVSGYMSRHREFVYEIRRRSITFYTSKSSIAIPSSVSSGEVEWHDLNLPLGAEFDQFCDQLLITLRSDWTVKPGLTFTKGALLAVPILDFVQNDVNASFVQLFSPSDSCSLESHTITKDFVILQLLDTVKSRYVFWNYKASSSEWVFVGQEEEAVIRGGYISAVDEHESNLYWLTTSSFVQPSTLSLGDAEEGPAGIASAKILKSLPPQFDAQDLVERQFMATSEDGTSVSEMLLLIESSSV